MSTKRIEELKEEIETLRARLKDTYNIPPHLVAVRQQYLREKEEQLKELENPNPQT